MKRWLICILAAALLLCGCDNVEPPETTQTIPPQTTEATTLPPAPSLFEGDGVISENTKGAVQTIAPDGGLITYGFMGDDLVFFQYRDECQEAVRVDSATGQILAQAVMPESLDLWLGIGLGPDKLICYDAVETALRVYDSQFREQHMVNLPEEIYSNMAFTEDLSTLYYSTDGEIRALDVNSGISRLLLKMENATFYIYDLLFEDSMIHCLVGNNAEYYDGFFSTVDGHRMGKDESVGSMESLGDFYLVRREDGPVTEVLLGHREGEIKSFQAEDAYGEVTLLGRTGRLTQTTSDLEGSIFGVYESERGTCQGKVFLKGITWLSNIQEDSQGKIWFVAMDPETETDVLCCWDPAVSGNGDDYVRVGRRYTAENPNEEGLALCKLRAQELESRFGVELYIHTDPIEPYDYAFTYEYQISALDAGLDALEKALESFPEGMLQTAASVTNSGKFHIGLVRAMTGTEYNTVTDVQGLQYWIDGDCYITLLAQDYIQQTLYHELCHAFDTYVTANSIHYDFWSDNNPEGFEYDFCYTEYQNHWDSPWLEDENRAFIDSYSMTYPHEDRARVMEYAMTPYNETYFASETMQAKLRQLCMGIREAFHWEKSQETFLWEQYLLEPLKMK